MPQTVAELIRAQARVMWWCDAGGHHGDLDLERVASLRGADTALANRRPPCPVAGCPGRVAFKDHTRVFARSLDTIAVHDPQGFAYEDRRRAELLALGYRMEMGKWVAPQMSKGPAAEADGAPTKAHHSEHLDNNPQTPSFPSDAT